MLTPNDYSHLKLLYDRFEKMNASIKNFAELRDWTSIENLIPIKEDLMRQIIFFEKPRLNFIKENDELNKLRIHLIELEKENIKLIKTIQTETKSELISIKKAKNLINTYEPETKNSVSTFQIIEDV